MRKTMTALQLGSFTAPRTGVELHACRALALGVSAYAVAARLSVTTMTLLAWERSWQPIPEPRASEWRRALAEVATERKARLEREGLPAEQMHGSDFARALSALSA